MALVPHVLAYQGSKRKLAPAICALFPGNIDRLFEPFAGSAAITLYAATHGLAKRFVIGDKLKPLVELHKAAVESPHEISAAYARIWHAQPLGDAATEYFYTVREQYSAERDAARLLYLILRCVANAVRFASNGNFNQSPDKRRRGTHPDRVRKSIYAMSRLLRGKTEFRCGDFEDASESANKGDLVYMDPPYQGTTEGSDKRYFAQVDRARLLRRLQEFTDRGVPYVLSYDGRHGEKSYGEELPGNLYREKLLLRAGRSTQGTLNGEHVITYESVYLSGRSAAAE